MYIVQCTHYKAANNFQHGAYYLIYNTRQSIFSFGIFFYFRSLSVRAKVCFHIFMWLMGFWCCCLFDKTCTRTTRHFLPISTQWTSRQRHTWTDNDIRNLVLFQKNKSDMNHVSTKWVDTRWLCIGKKNALHSISHTSDQTDLKRTVEQWNRAHGAREKEQYWFKLL